MFLLAVYWTRNVTQEHAIPLSTRTTHKKLRKLNSIASPILVVLLFLPYGLTVRFELEPFYDLRLSKKYHLFFIQTVQLHPLWLPAFSRGHVCLREQGDAKIHLAQNALQSTFPRRFSWSGIYLTVWYVQIRNISLAIPRDIFQHVFSE